MSTAHLSGIELLKLGNEGRKTPFLNQYWPYIMGVTFGIGSGVAINLGSARPLFSGIQKHIGAVAGWTALLSWVQNKRNNYLAEKDAVLKHYIELHPDDFPTPERKKVGDMLQNWIPIR